MYYKITLFAILVFSDHRKMKHSSFESSQWDKSNCGSFIDAE
jgi:hypothetical protein